MFSLLTFYGLRVIVAVRFVVVAFVGLVAFLPPLTLVLILDGLGTNPRRCEGGLPVSLARESLFVAEGVAHGDTLFFQQGGEIVCSLSVVNLL